MLVRIKKLNPSAVIPTYAKDGDAGMDMIATKVINENLGSITYGTDIAMEIPKGFVGLIFPRSSIRKTNLQLSNSVGVVDSGYRGEIQATFNKIQGIDNIERDILTNSDIDSVYRTWESQFQKDRSNTFKGQSVFVKSGNKFIEKFGEEKKRTAKSIRKMIVNAKFKSSRTILAMYKL
jgi:deoxyuridine 5'-triphosphate nucleotidohydrolase